MNNSDLLKKILKFRKERNWKKFHTPKNLAISISLEANELLEHYQWLSTRESLDYSKKNKTEISEEMADVFIYLLLMAHDLDIDLLDASVKKIKKNYKKYPISKSKGNSKKYNKL
jgi:NTP pyrophosphatase (non-canonical NTP hydrolase)